jgi:hypothetical protein
MKRNFYKAKFPGYDYFNWNRNYRRGNYRNCEGIEKGLETNYCFTSSSLSILCIHQPPVLIPRPSIRGCKV